MKIAPQFYDLCGKHQDTELLRFLPNAPQKAPQSGKRRHTAARPSKYGAFGGRKRCDLRHFFKCRHAALVAFFLTCIICTCTYVQLQNYRICHFYGFCLLPCVHLYICILKTLHVLGVVRVKKRVLSIYKSFNQPAGILDSIISILEQPASIQASIVDILEQPPSILASIVGIYTTTACCIFIQQASTINRKHFVVKVFL